MADKITEEEKKSEEFIEYRPVILFKTKRNLTKKCRLTYIGNADPPEMFNLDDLFDPFLDEHFHKIFTALAIRTSDVAACFRSHNAWDRSKYPRKI